MQRRKAGIGRGRKKYSIVKIYKHLYPLDLMAAAVLLKVTYQMAESYNQLEFFLANGCLTIIF